MSGGITNDDTDDWFASRRTVPVIVGVDPSVGVLSSDLFA